LILWRSIAGAIANVALNILLIPHFGAIGSAFATLAAQCMTAYFLDLSSRKTWPIFRMKTSALSGYWMLAGKARYEVSA
jgi:PST family polysaccharide transporter